MTDIELIITLYSMIGIGCILVIIVSILPIQCSEST
jgi:hypothetical protein